MTNRIEKNTTDERKEEEQQQKATRTGEKENHGRMTKTKAPERKERERG